MLVLAISKNGEDPLKYEGTREVTTFLPLLVYRDFPDVQGQLTPLSEDLVEIQTHSSFYDSPGYLQE